jgi:hypothetical protein
MRLTLEWKVGGNPTDEVTLIPTFTRLHEGNPQADLTRRAPCVLGDVTLEPLDEFVAGEIGALVVVGDEGGEVVLQDLNERVDEGYSLARGCIRELELAVLEIASGKGAEGEGTLVVCLVGEVDVVKVFVHVTILTMLRGHLPLVE